MRLITYVYRENDKIGTIVFILDWKFDFLDLWIFGQKIAVLLE